MQSESFRPRLRGVSHRIAAPTLLAGFVYLAVLAPDARARAVVVVYGFCVTAMLSVSAVYHSGRLSPTAATRLRRVDHSTILLAIAGTYTAVTGLALHGRTRAVLLIAIWVAAGIGIVLRVTWIDAPRAVTSLIFVVVGWFILVNPPAYWRALSGSQLVLIALGGVAYTVGGVVYALRKPDPWPDTFGFHEVFHALVVVGASLHFVAVVLLVLAA